MADYGKREDGSIKGSGWLGEIPTADNKNVMTELSIGVNIGGKEYLIPSIVPTLSPKEISHLQQTEKPTKEIEQKAVEFAKSRIEQWLSVWANE